MFSLVAHQAYNELGETLTLVHHQIHLIFQSVTQNVRFYTNYVWKLKF